MRRGELLERRKSRELRGERSESVVRYHCDEDGISKLVDSGGREKSLLTDGVEIGEPSHVLEGGEGVVREDESFERMQRFDHDGRFGELAMARIQDCNKRFPALS